MYGDRNTFARKRKSSRGFTLLELLMSMAVGVILTAVSVPMVNSSLVNYRMNSSVTMVSSAINSARYQAIYQGYPFTLTFTKSGGTYQLASQKPPATSFSNVGGAIPFEGGGMALNQDTVTLRFSPGGVVTSSAGDMSDIELTYKGQTRKIAVSTYGKLTVTKL